MQIKYIAIIDSGVGGLSVLKKMVNAFPNEKYIYFGDNQNAPYGNKNKRELKKIVLENLILLNDYKIKFLIVACNTLSSNLLSFIKENCNYPVFGIFPPVEYFLIKNEKILLLSTVYTANNYVKNSKLTLLPQKELAYLIEQNLFNLQNIDVDSIVPVVFSRFDRVILGCTHYNFVKKTIFNHFTAKKISCSEDFVVDYVSKNVKSKKTLEKIKRYSIKFLGKNSKINKDFWDKVVKPSIK